MSMTRKEFLQSTAALAAGAAGIGSVACGSDDSSGGSGASGGAGGGSSACTVTVANDHHDALVVPRGDVDAAATKTYMLTGTHTHEVLVLAGDFETIAREGSVTVTSSTTTAHEHNVTIKCA